MSKRREKESKCWQLLRGELLARTCLPFFSPFLTRASRCLAQAREREGLLLFVQRLFWGTGAEKNKIVRATENHEDSSALRKSEYIYIYACVREGGRQGKEKQSNDSTLFFFLCRTENAPFFVPFLCFLLRGRAPGTFSRCRVKGLLLPKHHIADKWQGGKRSEKEKKKKKKSNKRSGAECDSNGSMCSKTCTDG